MGFGLSIFLIAVGAVLAFAVTAEVAGVDVNPIGWILMILGVAGVVLSVRFWSSWGRPASFGSGTTSVKEQRPSERADR
jgi:Domain of unknown function (DUF6458)